MNHPRVTDKLHDANHPYRPGGVYREDNPDGCTRKWCTEVLPLLVDAVVEANLAPELRSVFEVGAHNFNLAQTGKTKLEAIYAAAHAEHATLDQIREILAV